MPEKNEISHRDQPVENNPDIIDATHEGDYRLQENKEGIFEFIKKEKVKDKEKIESENLEQQSELQKNQEMSAKEATQTILERNVILIDPFNEYIEREIGGNHDVRGDFLIDGSPIVSQEYVLALPERIQAFLANGRIAMPPNLHVYNEGKGSKPHMAVRNVENSVALRGIRFYGMDGKYQWGPNKQEALQFLLNNIEEDINILSEIAQMDIEKREDWLTKIALWDYVRNDLYAAYYLKRCQQAIENNGDEDSTKNLENALEEASTGYFDTVSLRKTSHVSKALPELMQEAKSVIEKLAPFIEKNPNLDTIRAHRELDTPQSLVFAFHLAYNTDKVRDTDLIVVPLYGALDIGQALRYTMKYGDEIMVDVADKQPATKMQEKPIVHILYKIVRRSVSHSETQGTTKLAPSRVVMLDAIDDRIRQKIMEANKILCVDDSAGTFGSREEIKGWIHNTFRKDQSAVQWVVAHAGTRWAAAQNTPYRELVDAEAVFQTPTSKKFKSPAYGGGRNSYMPDAQITESMLRTERTIFSIPELVPIIDTLRQYGIVEAVGYDLYETLVRRPVSRPDRRKALNDLATQIFQIKGYALKAGTYGTITRSVWAQEVNEKRKNHQEIEFISVVQKMVRAVLEYLGRPFDNLVVSDIANTVCQKELEYELSVTVPDEGVLETLDHLNSMGIPQGIYSNTPYPDSWIQKIAEKTELLKFIDPSAIISSSQTGIVKPAPETIYLLAGKLDSAPSKLVFVGNSKADITAAQKAGAICVHRLYPGEFPRVEARLKKWKEFQSRIHT